MLAAMDREEFWKLIDEARATVADPADAEAVAARAAALLATRPPAEIIATEQVLWDRMGDSYRSLLWGGAYVINGGCSDDGFDYFRGWLLLQGREVFEGVVADPDALAGLPAVRAASEDGRELECEAALGIPWDAYRAATGAELPSAAFTVEYADPDGDFDVEDDEERERRLPRLSALYQD